MVEMGENKIKELVLKLDLKGEGDSGSGKSHAPSVTSLSTDLCSYLSLSEALDPKIVTLLRGWHPSSYLLFSVYSVDGSLLSGWLTSSTDTSRGGSLDRLKSVTAQRPQMS